MASYLAQQKRNREQSEEHFKKRYNPADDVMAALDEIDEKAYGRKKDEDKKLFEKQKYASEVALKSNQFAEKQKAHEEEEARKQEELKARTLKERELERKRSMEDTHAQMEAGPSADDYAKQAAAAGMPETPRGAKMRAGGLRKDEIAAKAAEMGMSPSAFMDEIMSIDERIKGERKDKELKRTKTESEIEENKAQAGKLAAANTPEAIAAKKAKAAQKEADDAQKRELTGLQIIKARQETGEEGTNKPLTPGETEDVVALENALASLKTIARTKTGKDGGAPVNTGPIEDIADFIRGKIGSADPRMTTFKAQVGSQLADYIKSISGATVGVEERAELLKNVPTVSDDDEEFMAKLLVVRDILKQKLSIKKEVFSKTGKDTRGFSSPPARPKPRAPKKVKPMTDAQMDDIFRKN